MVGPRPTEVKAPGRAPLPEKILAGGPPAPKPSGGGSNIVSNVLLFLALCSVFLVVVYVVNKDAPKEMSPFEGPPPASRAGSAAGGRPAVQNAVPPNATASVSGTVQVAKELEGASLEGTLFIVVRNQGMPTQGPPLAVRRYKDPVFPLSYVLSANDVMMPGMPFSGPFDISVRLDGDGNAMTKAPGDLVTSVSKSGVSPGDANVVLRLDKRL